jgi:hypothetical protein
VTSIEITRSVLADPSSVALVLAGPAARELWPQADDRPASQRPVALVNAPPTTAVTVDPPRRTGVGFLTRMLVRAGAPTVAAGRLTIRPAAGGGCEIALVLTTTGDRAGELRRDVDRYLDNLVRVSLERSSAA